jgi:aminopeptidase N
LSEKSLRLGLGAAIKARSITGMSSMQFRPFAAAALVAGLLLIPSASAQSERHWFEGGPTPVRYEIAITPDMEAGTFQGQTSIVVQADEAAATVSMNQLDITVTRATIDGQTVAFSADNETQTLTLTPRRALRAGRHTIRLTYSGRIYDDAYGLFRLDYQQDGQPRRMLATQFEPGDARRLSPMWDQPNRRAVFSVTLTGPSDLMPISNMPVAQTRRLSGGLTRTTFQDSPSMASYLLFIGLGDFERVTANVGDVELGVVVRRGETARAQFALNAGVETLTYFEEYFGIDYPLPKLDMIGVPGAGGFGAMENWGAILYFDQFLLVDEARSTEGERRGIYGTVAHEIAHQWFGNLVTMTWWNDLWLNEGFASWMAAKAVDALHPEWQPWLTARAGGVEGAMSLDARVGTHPVVQTVNTIDEANLAFDAISYQKGLGVIRMLEAYVGEDAFRRGVHDYLSARQYGNSVTTDLWSAVQAASGQPILEIANSFTLQPGFPLLQAEAQCPAGGAVNVTQRRFALDDASRTAEVWPVPVTARALGGEPTRAVLPAQTPAQNIALAGACNGYVLNAGQSGFFRVRYDSANFARLVAAYSTLDVADQLGLVLDYYAFGRSGDGPMTDYLELVNVLPANADPVLIADTAGSMAALVDYAEGRPSEDSIKAYARSVLQPYLARLGWETQAGEGANERLARAAVIGTLGGLGDEAVLAEARRRAGSTEPGALDPSVRNTVLGLLASQATEEEYEALLAQARAASDFVEQRRLWRRLASADDEALARRTLALTLGDDMPRQLRPQVVGVVANSHPALAWNFLVENRTAIEAMLDPLQRLDYPPQIAGQSSDPAIADALVEYARDFPEGAQAQVASTAANIRSRALVADRVVPEVEAWIAQRNRPARRGR